MFFFLFRFASEFNHKTINMIVSRTIIMKEKTVRMQRMWPSFVLEPVAFWIKNRKSMCLYLIEDVMWLVSMSTAAAERSIIDSAAASLLCVCVCVQKPIMANLFICILEVISFNLFFLFLSSFNKCKLIVVVVGAQSERDCKSMANLANIAL